MLGSPSKGKAEWLLPVSTMETWFLNVQKMNKIKFKHINQLVQSINMILQDSIMFWKAKLKHILGSNAKKLLLEVLIMLFKNSQKQIEVKQARIERPWWLQVVQLDNGDLWVIVILSSVLHLLVPSPPVPLKAKNYISFSVNFWVRICQWRNSQKLYMWSILTVICDRLSNLFWSSYF